MFDVGDSFELRNQYGVHLHVIIAEASDRMDGDVMLVYLSSSKSYRDETTIIKFGEHPFITKRNEVSWIRYRNIMVCSRTELSKLIVNHYGCIDEGLLQRIQNGIENSDYVDEKKKKLFREWHLDRLYRLMKS